MCSPQRWEWITFRKSFILIWYMISIIVKVMKAIYKQRVAMDRINQKNLDGTTKNFQVPILVSSKYLRVKSCIFGSSQLQWWLWQSHILAVGLLIRGSYWRLWTSQFLKVFPNALNVENLAAMQWSWNIKPNYCNISLILGGGQCIRLKGSKMKKYR